MGANQLKKSRAMAEIGRKVIPAATMSNWRRVVDYQPIYLMHGKGGRAYDVDGNEYIDFAIGYGPAVLGYSNEHLREALHREIDRFYAPNVNDLEVRAAQLITEVIPSAELVRFACSGTEAVRGALRVARAHAGRDKYVRFNGHYHGGLDHIMGGIVLDPENPIPVQGERENDRYAKYANTKGRYSKAFQECYLIEWNDLPALERLLHAHGEDIAAVIMEPVMTNNFGCFPEPGYLEAVRGLCDEFGIVLIFYEVLTGFRIGLNGAQGYFGVTPDLTTLSKALGGGFPVSSVCGKREVMDTLTRADAILGGTFNGHPLAMAAVIAAIEEYGKEDGAVFRRIEELGARLRKGLQEIAREHDQNLLLQGYPGALYIIFTDRDKIRNHTEGCEAADIGKAARFGELLKERGVITARRFLLSAAHTEEDIEETLDRANDSMRRLKEEWGGQ
jgi:glutamate-1-semialdehyde 2,1-aminomutase